MKVRGESSMARRVACVTVVINLKPEQQRVIDLAIGSGVYQSPGEVLDKAFEIIREQLDPEDWMLEEREAVAALSKCCG